MSVVRCPLSDQSDRCRYQRVVLSFWGLRCPLSAVRCPLSVVYSWIPGVFVRPPSAIFNLGSLAPCQSAGLGFAFRFNQHRRPARTCAEGRLADKRVERSLERARLVVVESKWRAPARRTVVPQWWQSCASMRAYLSMCSPTVYSKLAGRVSPGLSSHFMRSCCHGRLRSQIRRSWQLLGVVCKSLARGMGLKGASRVALLSIHWLPSCVCVLCVSNSLHGSTLAWRLVFVEVCVSRRKPHKLGPDRFLASGTVD